MLFYVGLFVASLWPALARWVWPDKISWNEVGMQAAAGLALAVGFWYVGVHNAAARTEIRNGEVVGKYQDEVACTHSYSCPPCKKDKDGNETCATCYDHAHDYDWWVKTNVGNFTIPRVDRQGWYEPPRWSKFFKGQPVAREFSYQNYVAARDKSLFHQKVLDLGDLPEVPDYPRVRDYQYADRVIPVGLVLDDLPQWQDDLAYALKELGPKKQANITIILTATPDLQYRYKVEAAWEGVNKNDVVVVIGAQPEDKKILWADVITFAGNSGNEELRSEMRSALLDIGTVERVKVLHAVTGNVRALFERPQMKTFGYLKYGIQPETWFMWVFGILFILISGGMTFWFHRHDIIDGRVVRTY